MARVAKPLSDAEVKKAKSRDKNYKIYDGRGLYMLVSKAGGKHWHLKYRFDGKEKKIAIGPYPEISLAYAREMREKYRSDIAKEIDPSAERKLKRMKKTAEQLKAENTFQKVSTTYFNKRQELNEDYKIRLERAFKNDVYPFVGEKPIEDITPREIIHIVKQVEKRGAVESAHRLFTQLSKVFKYAVANQIADRNPCSEMDKGEILKPHTRKHYPTITDPKEIKALLLSIDDYTGDYTVRMALTFAPYVFVRPHNIRYAQWQEIDFDAKLWRIPADKMKTKKEHIVPLTDRSMEILKEMHLYSGDAAYIFHSLRSKTSPMSDATLNNALRRMGYSKDELVVHGFRAMFSTIAHEKSDFKHEVIETQLAHSVGSDVSRAYNRAMYLDERKELVQWWSDYLDEAKK